MLLTRAGVCGNLYSEVVCVRMFLVVCLGFVLVFFAACSYDDEYEELPEVEVPRLVYIALGDSVSEGYGVWAAADRHSSLFFAMLQEREIANEYVNLAVSGHTTGDLLLLFNGLGYADLEHFRHAAVITLNIGGNNILSPFFSHLPDLEDVQMQIEQAMGLIADAWAMVQDIMDFIGESRGAIDDVITFANEVIEFADNFNIFQIFRLNEIVSAAPPIIGGAVEVFDEIGALEANITGLFDRVTSLEILNLLALLRGDFPAELLADLQAGLDLFASEFGQILTWIENNAPNATLIVNTVYNPLPTEILGINAGVANESGRLIHDLNQIIREESRQRGFIISDIYSALSGRMDLMNINPDIIHPNPNGHNEIANINLQDLLNSKEVLP